MKSRKRPTINALKMNQELSRIILASHSGQKIVDLIFMRPIQVLIYNELKVPDRFAINILPTTKISWFQ